MDNKDKKIAQLEQEVANLKKAYMLLERRIAQLGNRAVRTDESVRRVNGEIINLKRRV